MHIKANGSTLEVYPYSISLLRKDNANTSFPKIPSVSEMAQFNMHPVTTVDEPTYNVRTQVLSQNNEPTLVSGVWTLGFTVTDRSTDELSAYDSQLAFEIREKRDALLTATDWAAMPDSPTMSAEMTAYRTALRNVPAQSDFPTVTWPTEVTE